MAGILDKLHEIFHELKDLNKFNENYSIVKEYIKKMIKKRPCNPRNDKTNSSNDYEQYNKNADSSDESKYEDEINLCLMTNYTEEEVNKVKTGFTFYEL